MRDVTLIWLSFEDTTLAASRYELRRWIEELDLPRAEGLMAYRSTAQQFQRAVNGRTVAYEDAEGRPCTLTGQMGKSSIHLASCSVIRDRDKAKVAEIKWYAPRRTEAGLVLGSSTLRHLVKSTLPAPDAAAAGLWIKDAISAFEFSQEKASSSTLRRIVRSVLAEYAVTLRMRMATYWLYDEDLPVARRLAEFLHRAVPSSSYVELPLRDYTDPGMFVASAQESMLEEVHHLDAAIERWVVNRSKSRPGRRESSTEWCTTYTAIVARLHRHEERLGAELAEIHRALLTTKEMILALDPTAHLQPVTG